MLKKLIAILVIAVSISLIAAEKYAILIAGDNTAANVPIEKQWNEGLGDNSEFWNDLYLSWEMLYNKGYKKENIIVIYSDGTDYWRNLSNPHTDTRYRPENVTGIQNETITQYSATSANIYAAKQDLLDKGIGEDDFLYVWAMSHGGSASQSSIGLIGTGTQPAFYEMTDAEFAGIINTIPAHKKVIQLSLNYAGGFANELEGYVVVSSTDTKSYRADDELKDGTSIPFLENEEIDSRTYYHGEMNFHIYSSTEGAKPDGTDNYNGTPYLEADWYLDDITTVNETSYWSNMYESGLGNTENYGEYSTPTSLQFPTAITMTIPFFDQIYKGVIGIGRDIDIFYDESFPTELFEVAANSHTYILEDHNITLDFMNKASTNETPESNSYVKMILGDNSILEGKGNNNIDLHYASEFIIGQGSKILNLTINLFSWGVYHPYIISEQVFYDNVIFNQTLDTQLEVTGNNTVGSIAFINDYYYSTALLNTGASLTTLPNSTMLIDGELAGNGNNIINIDQQSCLELNTGRIKNIDTNVDDDSFINAVNVGIIDLSYVEVMNSSYCEIQENSKLYLTGSSVLKMNAGTKLIMKDGSELIIESGSNLILEEGVRVEIQGNAKITGNVDNILGRVAVTDNSQLTIGTGSNI